jgi:hypothetical protein
LPGKIEWHCRFAFRQTILKSTRLALLTAALLSANAQCTEIEASGKDSATLTETAAMQMLEEADSTFRSLYKEARQKILAGVGPVLLLKDDRLILIADNRRAEIPYHVKAYDVLKSIDHVPLAIFLALPEGANVKIDKERLTALIKAKSMLTECRLALVASPLPEKTVVRQKRILDPLDEFLDSTIEQGFVSSRPWQQLLDALRAPLLANANEAIGAELESLNAKFTLAIKGLTHEQLRAMHVIVFGGHMPRSRYAFMQFFEKVLRQKGEGDKVIYCEGADSESQGLDLMGTHILDASIGSAFFADQWRMHRDLLGDGARRYLRNHHIKSVVGQN